MSGLFLGEELLQACLAVGPHGVGARGCIETVFHAINEGVEGAYSGRLVRGKARDVRQAGMSVQRVWP